jgi:hypothetical protein
MGIHHAPFAVPGCDCCPPNGRKETVTQTTSLPADARHAFLLAVHSRQLPREVSLRIFALAVKVERRVVTSSAPAAPVSRRHKWQTPGEPQPLSMDFGMMCLDADDLP